MKNRFVPGLVPILAFLFLCAYGCAQTPTPTPTPTPTAVVFPQNVQKTQGTNVVSNGPLVIGSGNDIEFQSGSNLLFDSGATITGLPVAAGSINQVQINGGSGALTANAAFTSDTFGNVGTRSLTTGSGTIGIGINANANIALLTDATLTGNNNEDLLLQSILTTGTAAGSETGIFVGTQLANGTHASVSYNGINVTTPTVTGDALVGGYMVNIGAPASGMQGALSITSGAVNLGNGTITSSGQLNLNNALAVQNASSPILEQVDTQVGGVEFDIRNGGAAAGTWSLTQAGVSNWITVAKTTGNTVFNGNTTTVGGTLSVTGNTVAQNVIFPSSPNTFSFDNAATTALGVWNGTTGALALNFGFSVAGTSTLTGNVTVGANSTTGSLQNVLALAGSNAGTGSGPYINFSDGTGALGQIGSRNAFVGGTLRNLDIAAFNGLDFVTNNLSVSALSISTAGTSTFGGAIVPATVGITGVISGVSATAGAVGEVKYSPIASGSAVSLTTATTANVTSIALTAGDWLVSGNINITATSATQTASSAGINTVTATIPADGSGVNSAFTSTTTTFKDGLTCSVKEVNISTSGTVFLVVNQTFSAGTEAAYGSLTAWRIR